MLTSADKVGGSKKGQKHADVILEWSLCIFKLDTYVSILGLYDKKTPVH